MQDNISLREAKGIKPTLRDYEKLLKNTEAQSENIREQNKLLRAQGLGLDHNSEKWRNIQSQVQSNNVSLRQMQQQQLEYQQTMRTLELTDAQNLLSALCR